MHRLQLRWFFFHDLFDCVQWQVIDQNGNVVLNCKEGFANEAACIADARAHGFCAVSQ